MFEAWALRKDAVEAEEEQLRQQIRALDDERRRVFYREYNKKLKDPDTYAVVNWLFLAGLHHFYLGRYGRGSINLLLMLAGITLIFFQPLAGVALILLVIVMELPALFRSQIIVADYNNRQASSLLKTR